MSASRTSAPRPAAPLALCLLGLGALPLAARPAAADTPALGFTANATANSFEDTAAGLGASSYVLGWSFTANAPLTVTSLGWEYDPLYGTSAVAFGPAGIGTHDVGLYDGLGTLLTSATVAYNGTGAGFSYAAAPPVALTAGATYTLAGVTGASDPFFYDIQDPTLTTGIGLVVNPALTYLQDQIAVGGSLTDPTGTDAANLVDPAYFGPNFQFRPAAAVPESPAGALLGLGLLPLGALAARRRKPAA